MSTIRPYFGQVFLTDRRSPYPDASDHNMVFAKLTIDESTKANVGTFNVRRYSFDLGSSYDWDKYRDHRAAQLISDSRVSVLAVQECEPEQDAYLAKKLPALTGVPWKAVSAPTNVGLLFKSDRWRLLATRNVLMNNGDDTDRRVVGALLQSVRTGSAAWFWSTHFGVGIALAYWRRYQARKVCELMSNLPQKISEREIDPKYFGDVRKYSVVMGDFNDYAPYLSTGVRKVFNEYGFRELRDRLSDLEMIGDTYSTKHTFGKLTPRDGRQIDAIMTPLTNI